MELIIHEGQLMRNCPHTQTIRKESLSLHKQVAYANDRQSENHSAEEETVERKDESESLTLSDYNGYWYKGSAGVLRNADTIMLLRAIVGREPTLKFWKVSARSFIKHCFP